MVTRNIVFSVVTVTLSPLLPIGSIFIILLMGPMVVLDGLMIYVHNIKLPGNLVIGTSPPV